LSTCNPKDNFSMSVGPNQTELHSQKTKNGLEISSWISNGIVFYCFFFFPFLTDGGIPAPCTYDHMVHDPQFCVFVVVERHEIVSCTACGRQVNHFQRDSFYPHPVLKVLICKVSVSAIFITRPIAVTTQK